MCINIYCVTNNDINVQWNLLNLQIVCQSTDCAILIAQSADCAAIIIAQSVYINNLTYTVY